MGGIPSTTSLLPRTDALALGQVLKRAIRTVNAGARAVVPGACVCVGAAIWTPPSAEDPADILRRAAAARSDARARVPGKVEADVDVGASEWKDDDGDVAG